MGAGRNFSDTSWNQPLMVAERKTQMELTKADLALAIIALKVAAADASDYAETHLADEFRDFYHRLEIKLESMQ